MINFYLKSLRGYWPTAGALSKGKLSALVLFVALLSVPIRKRLFGRNPKKVHLYLKSLGTVEFFVRDGADISALREVFAQGEYAVPGVQITPRHIVDLGGHIGSATLYFKSVYPNVKITVYEPDPENYSVLCKNIEKYNGVRVVQAAVADRSGMISLYKNAGSSTKSSTKEKYQDALAVEVRAVSLSDVIEKDVDVIKFDIEGAEYDVFKSLPDGIINQIKLFVGEFHYGITKRSKQEFEALFSGYVFSWKDIGMSCAMVVIEKQ